MSMHIYPLTVDPDRAVFVSDDDLERIDGDLSNLAAVAEFVALPVEDRDALAALTADERTLLLDLLPAPTDEAPPDTATGQVELTDAEAAALAELTDDDRAALAALTADEAAALAAFAAEITAQSDTTTSDTTDPGNPAPTDGSPTDTATDPVAPSTRKSRRTPA